uniref:Ig domain-containing protein n=1 Tax=Anopheles stephensi TaxID=30069 RepID=A0A182YPY3_ANOST
MKADTKAIQAIHEHVITHNSRVTVSHADQNTWNLHIKSVTEEDRGGYMCQLNTDPMKSQLFHQISSQKIPHQMLLFQKEVQ